MVIALVHCKQITCGAVLCRGRLQASLSSSSTCDGDNKINPPPFTHLSLCCGGIDAFSLAVWREGGETVLALDKKLSQIEVAHELYSNLGFKNVDLVHRDLPISAIADSPDMLEKVRGLTFWSFTPDCGPYGTARGPNASGGQHGLSDVGSQESHSQFFRLLSLLSEADRPECILIENVQGYMSASYHTTTDADADGVWVLRRLKFYGYNVEVHVESGDLSELPQNRTRLFVVALKGQEAWSTWQQHGWPAPWGPQPPFNSIFCAAESQVCAACWHVQKTCASVCPFDVRNVWLLQDDYYFLPDWVVNKFTTTRGYWLNNMYHLVTRDTTQPQSTLRSTYRPHSGGNQSAKSMPYGTYVVEIDGRVRMLTERELGRYMGLSSREVAALPVGRNTYFALGSSVMVPSAQKIVRALLLGLGRHAAPIDRGSDEPLSVTSSQHVSSSLVDPEGHFIVHCHKAT